MAEQEEVFVDDAWYDAMIESAKTDESANTGTPGIIFKWTVTEGEMAGKSVMDERWVTQNSVVRHQKEILAAIDYDIGKEDLEEIRHIAGRVARIQVQIKEWPEGSKKFQVKVKRIRKKGEDDLLPPHKRIAKMLGNENVKDAEWEKEKRF